jgi:lipoyl(octanoyl) transferase
MQTVEWITLPNLSDYCLTLKLMERKVEQIINKQAQETIYLAEHQEIYTAGTGTKTDELLSPISEIPLLDVGRGGKLTYHGPGQRVIYPILDLASPKRSKDVKLYVSNLEKWIINTLMSLKIDAFTVPQKIGIWVKDLNDREAKIASIGIRLKKWVAYHGIAINISTDMQKFTKIIPCGLKNSYITSIKELKKEITMQQFDIALKNAFEEVFVK